MKKSSAWGDGVENMPILYHAAHTVLDVKIVQLGVEVVFFKVMASGGLYFYYLHQQFTVLNNLFEIFKNTYRPDVCSGEGKIRLRFVTV